MKSENEKALEALREEKDKAIETEKKSRTKIKRLEEALTIKEEETDRMSK